MGGVAEAVQERDGYGVDARRRAPRSSVARSGLVERRQHRAVGVDALVDLDDAVVQRRGHVECAREQVGPLLVADQQRVAEARVS